MLLFRGRRSKSTTVLENLYPRIFFFVKDKNDFFFLVEQVSVTSNSFIEKMRVAVMLSVVGSVIGGEFTRGCAVASEREEEEIGCSQKGRMS